MDTETAIFAAIAVLLLARLWFVLGRKNEDDRERPNPFARLGKDELQSREGSDEGDAVFSPRKDGTPAGPIGQIPSVFKPLKVAPASLEGGLSAIKTLDPLFDEKKFLQGARETFASVISAFAKGDLAGCENLLGPKVLAMFRAAIEARRAAGEMMENRIAKITQTETASARADGDTGIIGVRFVSEQENILRDKEGRVVGGAPGQLEEVTDNWIFSRNLKAPQSPWQLVETHG